MGKILSRNLKKFRLSQNLTQEQAAEALNVSAQTISRWECCTTLPEATKLPEIAQLYGVTIDDLFKNNAVAYRNYAQRLAAVYESSGRSEDFILAEREFHRLIDRGDYVPDDLRMLGVIYQFMMISCAEKAQHWFDHTLQEGNSDPELCHRTQLQKMRLLAQTGKGAELIARWEEAVEDSPHNAENHVLLTAAYMYTGRYAEALACAESAMLEFPGEWELCVYAGESCIHLSRYGEAIRYADHALQLRPTWLDAKYVKARCYEKMGEAERAAGLYREIASDLRQEGAEVEAESEIEHAKHILDSPTFP